MTTYNQLSNEQRDIIQTLINQKKSLDWLAYLEAHKDEEVSIVQMDTVEGIKGGKVLFTLLLAQSNLMLTFIMYSQTTTCVNMVFDWIRTTIGMDNFKKIFRVILIDNVHEFFDPLSIELDSITKEQVSHLFYCDPSASYQVQKS